MKKILILILIVAFILTTSLSILQVRGYEGSDNQKIEKTSNTKENYFAYININDKGNAKIGPFKKDETIFLTAQKIEGYEFLNWEIDGEIFTEDKEISIKIDEENIKIKANYHDLVKDIDILIQKADEEILNKNYNKAQEYLLEVYEYDKSIIEKSKYYENLEIFLADYSKTEENLNKFTGDNVLTVKNYPESIKEYEEKKPEAPKIEILKKDQETIRKWFYECLTYQKSIRSGKDIIEPEVEDAIKEKESEYFVYPKGISRFYSKRKLINAEIYARTGASFYGSPQSETNIIKYLDLKEVKLEENKVIISLEKNFGYPSLGYYNDPSPPYIKSCDVVFKIKRYDDGIFKIRDYYVDNMITEG